MEERKYEILYTDKPEHTIIQSNQETPLYRIRALRDVRDDVKAGDLGGFVASERNLSQEGSCWIYGDGIAYQSAKVLDDATIGSDVMACDQSIISGHSSVDGSIMLEGSTIIKGNQKVTGNRIIKNATIF